MSDTAVVDLRRTDVFAWLKGQAEALRAREGGRNAIAYDELAEEVDGLAQLVRNKVYSLTARIIEHLYKLEFVNSPRDRPGWRKEVLAFRKQLSRNMTPTLRNEVFDDLDDLHRTEAKGLLLGELLPDLTTMHAVRPDGYSWAEITDADWWPEPADAAPPGED